jgi:CHAD domain-containing protein
MLTEDPDDKHLHKIRQNLKIMSTIATIVYSFKPGKHLDQVITALNKTEMMIGDWHDRIVLRDSVDRFMKESESVAPSDVELLSRMKESLDQQCRKLVQHFIPEVALVLEIVLSDPE